MGGKVRLNVATGEPPDEHGLKVSGIRVPLSTQWTPSATTVRTEAWTTPWAVSSTGDGVCGPVTEGAVGAFGADPVTVGGDESMLRED